jgi:hypothetical protein
MIRIYGSGPCRESPGNLQAISRKIKPDCKPFIPLAASDPPSAAAIPDRHSRAGTLYLSPSGFVWKSAISAGLIRAGVITDIRGPRTQDLARNDATAQRLLRGGSPRRKAACTHSTPHRNGRVDDKSGCRPASTASSLFLPGGRECRRRSNLQCCRRPSFSAAW